MLLNYPKAYRNLRYFDLQVQKDLRRGLFQGPQYVKIGERYRALSTEENPEFATIMKVVKGLGLRFHAGRI
jgi:ribulose 1,5-bisphosphate carboxylase large subunit-like protein